VALRHLQLLAGGEVLANVVARSSQLEDLLRGRVEGLDCVRAVRVRGLMAGVELAAPDPKLRWGRRSCAAAVRRGVLLRPLGDVVVLMPPLTIGADEIERIVDVVVASLAEACR
jgi:adenosylmethionine---8-amino-7-oxononanoate aminotransferase